MSLAGAALLLALGHGGEHVPAAVAAEGDEGAAPLLDRAVRAHDLPVSAATAADRLRRGATERRRVPRVWGLCGTTGRQRVTISGSIIFSDLLQTG